MYASNNEGAQFGSPPAGHPPTGPDCIDYTRQPTARSARRIVRHAAIVATQASADLAAAVGGPTDLTSAVHASADLTSAVHTSAGLTSSVHAPADLTSAVSASAVPTTVCCQLEDLSPGEGRNAPAPGFSLHPTRPTTPLRSTAPLRPATLSRRVPSLATVARQAMSHEGSSSPSPSPVSVRTYGSTPRSPASTACSPMTTARFPATPEGQVDFEPRAPRMPAWKRRPPSKDRRSSAPMGRGGKWVPRPAVGWRSPPPSGSGGRWGHRPAKDGRGPRPMRDSCRRGPYPLQSRNGPTRS